MDKIDIRDLRVGSWVNISNNNPQEKDLFPAKVASILCGFPNEYLNMVECIIPKEGGGYGLASCSADTLLPIPLTAEILEKNGFEELMSEGEEVAAMFGRKPEPTGVWQYGFGKFDSVAYVPETHFLRIKFMEAGKTDFNNIRYVHEMQHCLRLLNVEKEIEL